MARDMQPPRYTSSHAWLDAFESSARLQSLDHECLVFLVISVGSDKLLIGIIAY